MSIDEQRIQRWLDWLRDGSDADKIAARRGLAGVFEARGMLDEAIELLERNVEAGVRGTETLRWLSRLYEARDVDSMSSGTEDEGWQPQWAPPRPEPPKAVDLHARPLQPWAVRDLAPYLTVEAGLGVMLGTGLWMLTPILNP